MPLPFPTKVPICPRSSQKTSLWSTNPVPQQVDATVFFQILQNKKKSNKKLPSFRQSPPSLSAPSDERLSQNVPHLMKGYLEKRWGLNKPEHINPKALGITSPSADHAITSKCISLSNQLVWQPVDPHHHALGHHGCCAESA